MSYSQTLSHARSPRTTGNITLPLVAHVNQIVPKANVDPGGTLVLRAHLRLGGLARPGDSELLFKAWHQGHLPCVSVVTCVEGFWFTS